MTKENCVICSHIPPPQERKYLVRSKNIKLYSAFYPNIKKGRLCTKCYKTWLFKSKEHPKMYLKTLFCGICQKEEPEVKFSKTFENINGRNYGAYQKATNKKNLIIGPICISCSRAFPLEKSELFVKKETKKQIHSKINNFFNESGRDGRFVVKPKPRKMKIILLDK
eukprot:gene2384-2849_t